MVCRFLRRAAICAVCVLSFPGRTSAQSMTTCEAANPFDASPDDAALQACLDNYDWVLLKPDRGEIYVDEKEISHLKEEELAEVQKKFAYVFQGGALFGSMTARLTHLLAELAGLFGNALLVMSVSVLEPVTVAKTFPFASPTSRTLSFLREPPIAVIGTFGLPGCSGAWLTTLIVSP